MDGWTDEWIKQQQQQGIVGNENSAILQLLIYTSEAHRFADDPYLCVRLIILPLIRCCC